MDYLGSAVRSLPAPSTVIEDSYPFVVVNGSWPGSTVRAPSGRALDGFRGHGSRIRDSVSSNFQPSRAWLETAREERLMPIAPSD